MVNNVITNTVLSIAATWEWFCMSRHSAYTTTDIAAATTNNNNNNNNNNGWILIYLLDCS
jgi:hypothetical protein